MPTPRHRSEGTKSNAMDTAGQPIEFPGTLPAVVHATLTFWPLHITLFLNLLLQQLCRCQGRRRESDHLHACIRRRRTGGGGSTGRDRAPGQAGVVVMGAGVDLGAHRTGRVRHEVLRPAGDGAHDVCGSDIAAHACIGHDRASKVGVLAACRRGTAKRGALTASEAETGRYLHEPAPSRPCRRSKESSHRLEGHGAGSCSNDLHGHRKGTRCKEQALECLMPKCLQQCKTRDAGTC